MGLGDIIAQIAEDTISDEPLPPPPPPTHHTCERCWNTIPIEDDVCQQCQQEESQGYRVRSLAGRCRNGAERDRGRLFHALKPGERRAVCGAEPGKTSAGWSEWGRGEEPTCTRCRRKLAKEGML